jgi:site-specific recombinase XerD
MHHAAREALRAWLHERANHRGAATPALFLNRLGGRLLARSIRTIIAELGPCRRPGTRCRTRRREVPGTPHTLGHTVATQLLRNGVDIVTVADIMGHARIDTVRLYTRSSEADRARAIEKILITDE